MRAAPIAIPTMKDVNGSAPTPRFQPRCSWKVMGYYCQVSTGKEAKVAEETYCFKQKVKYAVDKTHVSRHQCQNGLLNKHDKRPYKINR